MGNSSSSSDTNSNSNSKQQAPKKQQSSSVGAKSVDQLNEELDNNLRDIEYSLKHDTSQANLVVQFANIIGLEGNGKMAIVNGIVNSMGVEWRNLMKNEGKLEFVVGKEEMNSLRKIRGDYFYLLLKTKTVIVGLLEQSKTQKENVADALEVVREAQATKQYTLSEGDQLLYDESIENLVRWIDQSGLVKINKEWDTLRVELDKQKNRFMVLFDKYKCKNMWKKVLIGLGVVGILSAIFALAIVTSGAAAGIAAGTVKFVAVGALKIATAHLIAASIAVGVATLMVGGGLVYGYHVKPATMANKIQQITTMLQDYILTGREIQKSVSKMQCTEAQIEEKAKLNYTHCKKLASGLNDIDTYLDAYIGQGKSLVTSIEEACDEFINK